LGTTQRRELRDVTSMIRTCASADRPVDHIRQGGDLPNVRLPGRFRRVMSQCCHINGDVSAISPSLKPVESDPAASNGHAASRAGPCRYREPQDRAGAAVTDDHEILALRPAQEAGEAVDGCIEPFPSVQ
jgi:hypothetical protein